MATLTHRQKLALNHQLERRRKIERLFRTKFRTALRSQTNVLLPLLLKGYYLDTGHLRSVRSEIERTLLLLYRRAMSLGSNFTRNSLSRKSTNDYIEVKLHNIQIKSRVEDLNRNIRTRIDSEIADFVEQSSRRVVTTLSIELNDLRRRVINKLGNSPVSDVELRRYLEAAYRKLIDRKATTIAITETTRAIEKAKLIEAEELALDAIDFDEDNLDEDQEELLAELAALADEGDGDSIELLLATAGAASLLALAGLTKTWVAVMDDATREAHADADGDTVSIEDSFSVGGDELEYPGDENGEPGNTINCRCTVTYNIG